MRFLYATVALGTFFVALMGCASTAPTRFYVLDSLSISEKGPVRAHEGYITVGIGPIDLPGYLNRPQIVSRMGPHSLQVAEFDRWAEPLEENFSRVMVENLSTLLGREGILVSRGTEIAPFDYRVAVEVGQFEGKPPDVVLLKARWMILEKDHKKSVLLVKKSGFMLPVDTRDYEALVSAKSKTVVDLSREIALEIRRISRRERETRAAPEKKEGIVPERQMAGKVIEETRDISGYTIHLESWQKEQTASERVRFLRSLGLEAFSYRVNLPEKGVYYRVFVGRFDDRMQASAFQDRIVKEYKLGKGIIKPVSALRQ